MVNAAKNQDTVIIKELNRIINNKKKYSELQLKN